MKSFKFNENMNEKSPYAVGSELCGGFSKEKYSKEITVLHQEILNIEITVLHQEILNTELI